MHRWWMMSSSIVTQHCQNTREPAVMHAFQCLQARPGWNFHSAKTIARDSREPYNTLQLQADSTVVAVKCRGFRS